jgi:hypothetical protein
MQEQNLLDVKIKQYIKKHKNGDFGLTESEIDTLGRLLRKALAPSRELLLRKGLEELSEEARKEELDGLDTYAFITDKLLNQEIDSVSSKLANFSKEVTIQLIQSTIMKGDLGLLGETVEMDLGEELCPEDEYETISKSVVLSHVMCEELSDRELVAVVINTTPVQKFGHTFVNATKKAIHLSLLTGKSAI